MKFPKAVFFILTVAASLALGAGTIVYRPHKDGDVRRVANVKIISIENGVMTIEVNDGHERINLRLVEGYYDTDLKNSSDGFDDNTPEYSVTVTNIDAPERAQKKVGSKLTKESFKISYRIVPNYTKEHSRDSVKYPFFYLYVMTEGSDGGQRPIYLIYGPKLANPGKKTYDKAAIMDRVLSSKRPNLYTNLGGSSGNISANDRREELSLSSISNKHAKIIAWRLEIWGKSDIIYEKNWIEPGIRLGQNWWQRQGL